MSDTTISASTPGVIEEDFDPNTGEIIEAEAISNDPGALVVQDAIRRLQSGNVSVYSTVQGTDFEAKKTVLNAVTAALPLADNLGKHIDLENVVVQAVELDRRDPAGNVITDEFGTPQKITQPRVILIDADGTAYYAISPVVLKSLETFMGVLGQPHEWPEPVGMKVERKKARLGNYYDMTLDSKPKAAAKK